MQQRHCKEARKDIETTLELALNMPGYGEVALERRLRDALVRLNPNFPLAGR